MGKTFKKAGDDSGKRFGWKAERQARRKDKKIQRGEYCGRRVARAAGEGDSACQ